jgi:hypothetical protein
MMRRTFEHQVLEEMRESGMAGALVFSAHVIPDLQVNHRNLVVFEQNHLEAVRECVGGEIKFRRANRGRLILRRKRHHERCGHADREKYRRSRRNPFPRVRPHHESLRSVGEGA